MASSTIPQLGTYASTSNATTTTLVQANLPNVNLSLPSVNNSQTQGTNNLVMEANNASNDSIPISLGGSSLPFSILDPYVVMNYIIKY